MKILIIAPQPFFAIRGTPLAIRELAGVFVKSGHKVDILTFHLGEDVDLPGLTIYRNRLFSRLIKSIPPGFSFGKFILDLVLLPRALFMILRNNYDVVHCVEESAYFISWFRWIRPFLFTYDMDSDIPMQLVESGKINGWFMLRFVKELERFTINRADSVVTICPLFTEKVKNLFPDKKVFQIEDVSVSDEIPDIRQAGGRKVILYTGNFEEYQGVELLIEAFEKIKSDWPDVDLLLVGGAEDVLKKRYSNKQIIFSGKRPISEMPGFLGKADILVSPRIKGENTPFKIYSYLASGKPILATNIISHTQILTNEKDALLVEPTVDGLAFGLNRLLSDNALAGRLGAGARRLFEENYTRTCYEKKVKDYLNFLEDGICRQKR